MARANQPRELGFRSVQVLDYIRATFASKGRAPSYTEIRDVLGFNDRAEVCRVIGRLENRGLLVRVSRGWGVRRIQLPGALTTTIAGQSMR